MAGATLADRLQVPPEWARGLDKVLGRWLTAIPADECNLAQPGLWIGPAQPARAGTLAAQLGGEHIPAFLNAIWLAESREEALSRLHSLSAGESLLTPTGDWFGPNWADLGEGMALGTLALLGERERLHTELAAGREALTDSTSSLSPPMQRGPSSMERMSWLSAPCASRSSSGSNCAKPGVCARGSARSACSAWASWGKSWPGWTRSRLRRRSDWRRPGSGLSRMKRPLASCRSRGSYSPRRCCSPRSR